MRTFSGAAIAVAFFACLAPGGAWAATPYVSATDALERGVTAYRERAYGEAIPALEFAAASDDFLARYYLARIYSDGSGGHADPGKAYAMFQHIADEHTDADPDDDKRAPFVGEAMTAVAGYLRTGLPDAGVTADPARAAEYLRYAAVYFRDENAQFELAKMQLNGIGGESDAETAKHWLAVLSRKGHPGAQAFLADLYWRGRHMERDHVRALALSNLAVSNSDAGERVWIEDINQNIFCSASAQTREQAAILAAGWLSRYARKPVDSGRGGVVEIALPERTCGDGSPVEPLSAPASEGGRSPTQPRALLEDASGALARGSEAHYAPVVKN